MTGFDRYLAVRVIGAVALVLSALTALTALFVFVEELRGRGPGNEAIDALHVVALTLPRRIHELVPYAVLLGVVIGLGEMGRHGEIVAVRASGVSLGRLFLAASLPALGFLMAGMLLGEVVAPGLEAAAAAKRAAATTAGTAGRGGVWLRSNDAFVHVGGVVDAANGAEVREYRFDAARRLVALVRAQTAVRDAKDGRWMLRDVQESALDGAGVRVDRFDTRPSVMAPGTALARDAGRSRDPRQLSLVALGAEIDRIAVGERARGPLALAWWSRALQPVAVLGLTALALVFVVGPLREVSTGARISAGIGVGLAFKYLEDLFAPMAIVWALPPVLAVAAPIVLCWCAAALGARRVG